MSTFYLPEHPEELNLVELNRRLHAGEICLNWTNVVSSLSPVQMAHLLKGFDVSCEHIIGFDTVPPFLRKRMLVVLQDQAEEQDRREAEKQQPFQGRAPAVWLPDGEEQDAEITMPRRKKGELNEAELVAQDKYGFLPVSSKVYIPLKRDHSADTTVIGAPPSNSPIVPFFSSSLLDMNALAMISDAPELAGKLQSLISAYRVWIEQQEARQQVHPQKGAEIVLQQCRQALGQMQAGLNLLRNDNHALQAFAFMNRAMYLLRIRMLYVSQKKYRSGLTPQDVDLLENRLWQPSQLAYILLNVAKMVGSFELDRKEEVYIAADRLWFPPSDEKTEARLGLAAYALGLNRLYERKKQAGERTVVVMRSLSRMFSSLQFQRISTLLCACETIRRTDRRNTWGDMPFHLGVWTGVHATTARPADASATQSHARFYTSSLLQCPWCGDVLDGSTSIEIAGSRNQRVRRMVLYCTDRAGICLFGRRLALNEGLPVLISDEGLDGLQPSLLIATVSNFAQLPWKKLTQILFD
jgi:hypothetical protein